MTLKLVYYCDGCGKENERMDRGLHIKENDEFEYDLHFCSEECKKKWKALKQKEAKE